MIHNHIKLLRNSFSLVLDESFVCFRYFPVSKLFEIWKTLLRSNLAFQRIVPVFYTKMKKSAEFWFKAGFPHKNEKMSWILIVNVISVHNKKKLDEFRFKAGSPHKNKKRSWMLIWNRNSGKKKEQQIPSIFFWILEF